MTIQSHSRSLVRCRKFSCRGGHLYILTSFLSCANKKGENVLLEVLSLRFKQIPKNYSIFIVLTVVLPVVKQFNSLSFCPWQDCL